MTALHTIDQVAKPIIATVVLVASANLCAGVINFAAVTTNIGSLDSIAVDPISGKF